MNDFVDWCLNLAIISMALIAPILTISLLVGLVGLFTGYLHIVPK